MKISAKLFLLSVTYIVLFTSCKKMDLAEEAASTPDQVSAPDTVAKATPEIQTYNRTVNVGTGSGNLIIDGSTMSLQCKDLIKITAGTYKGMQIKNIISADGCPITIKNEGLVEVTGNLSEMTLMNIKNLTISGDGTPGLAKGIVFRDNSYRAIQIYGTLDKFTLQNIAFKNIGDYVITFKYETAYTGGEDSYSKDIKFLNISCDNTGVFFNTSGSVQNGVVSGLIKNIEIANLDFQNSPTTGSVVYMGNVENYDIHNNKINNINTANNNHNGIFQLCGNGKFYNNYVSNHQGNAIRAWGHTIGSTPKDILIYNNIVINSRKYSGFEVQAFAINIVAGKTTYTNAKVFNNTCGNLNINNDWVGSVVDVYSLVGGKCEVFNNIGYKFQAGSPIANQQAELQPITSNNLYAATSTGAGLTDESTCKLTASSSAKHAGKATPILITDYYGASRNAITPSIGAAE